VSVYPCPFLASCLRVRPAYPRKPFQVFHNKANSWPYPQTFDQAGKACQVQTLFIKKIYKLWPRCDAYRFFISIVGSLIKIMKWWFFQRDRINHCEGPEIPRCRRNCSTVRFRFPETSKKISRIWSVFIRRDCLKTGWLHSTTWVALLSAYPGNTIGGSITLPLTSCLTGLESVVWLLTIFVFICN